MRCSPITESYVRCVMMRFAAVANEVLHHDGLAETHQLRGR